jgi:hypothetical protein
MNARFDEWEKLYTSKELIPVASRVFEDWKEERQILINATSNSTQTLGKNLWLYYLTYQAVIPTTIFEEGVPKQTYNSIIGNAQIGIFKKIESQADVEAMKNEVKRLSNFDDKTQIVVLFMYLLRTNEIEIKEVK